VSQVLRESSVSRKASRSGWSVRSAPQIGAEPAWNGGTEIPEQLEIIDKRIDFDEIAKKKKPGGRPALVRFNGIEIRVDSEDRE
jgi:hypothetical protein